MAALILSSVLLALATSTLAKPVTSTSPVCIVGAGPGGLTLAHELEAKGYSTVVFDKQPEVGGKCQVYYDGPNHDVFHPLGALLFTNQTYANTLPLIQAANVPLRPGISQHDWKYWIYGPGENAGTVNELPPTPAAVAALIGQELSKYTSYWTSSFSPLYTTPRYKFGVPPELTVTMSEWLSKNGYVALPTIMEKGMVPYGYGSIKETPALYMLQYFTPEILSAFLGVVPGYIVNFHEVFVKYSASIKGPVHVNTVVTKIDRASPAPIITYTSASGSSGALSCSDVILAFAPTGENLAAIDMSLTSQEREVFSGVDITSYWSSATVTKIGFPDFYEQSPFSEDGGPVGLLRLFEESPVTTTYSWAAPGSTLSIEDVKSLLASRLTALQSGIGITDPVVTESDVKDIRKWDYFPHFDSSELMSGYYAKYNAFQGQNHTYYTSGLNGFETVEFVIRAAKELVATFF